MKFVSALIAASVAVTLGSLSANAQEKSGYYTPVTSLIPDDLFNGAIGTSLRSLQDATSNNMSNTTSQVNASTVPSGQKTYVVGLRTTRDGNNFCSASLITPTHLVAGSYCTLSDVRWASIGSHYSNGTQDGEQIKIVAILNNPKTPPRASGFSRDVAVMQLEKPSSFWPVKLAAADDSDVQDGEWAVKMGWDDTAGAGTMAYELQREEVQLMSNENCLKQTSVDDTQVCSRGAANVMSCTGDSGGPLVVERPSGDVLVGFLTWGDDCGKPGYPSVYSRVSSAREWIDSVVGGECFY